MKNLCHTVKLKQGGYASFWWAVIYIFQLHLCLCNCAERISTSICSHRLYGLLSDSDIYFWVMGNEFWSISSPTRSWRICTTSARMKTCVSSKSWMMNFFPNADVSSRYRRNCFIAGSLFHILKEE